MASSSTRPSMDNHPIWKPRRKSKEEGEEAKKVYDVFAANREKQRQNFEKELSKMYSPQEREDLVKKLAEYGLTVDFQDHHVKYLPSFEPIKLDYDVCYVRHGKTEGNTEPRIYQGYCDYWENQLNETGKEQARQAAQKMESQDFKPDLIICSPLGRAIETGEAYFKNHPEIPCRTHYEAREQQFGDWDNRLLIHMPPESTCHLFYLDQNSLVKAAKAHVCSDGNVYQGENFVELILREAKLLKSLNQEPEVKQVTGRRAKVLMYGHSMAGAAISALLGHGKTFDDKGSIGFDGKYILPNATPTMLLAQKPKN